MSSKDQTKKSRPKIKVKDYDFGSEVDQSWSLYKIMKKAPPPGWEELFKNFLENAKELDEILDSKGEYLPKKCDIFNAYRWTPLDKVKVVIVGQDPYHTVLKNGQSQAMGASFSLRKGCPIQPSLKNIYKVLEKTVDGFEIPDHGNLRGWAKQGVLLLNICLTVEPGIPESHAKTNPWMELIQETFRYISEKRPNTVILSWGKYAQVKLGKLSEIKKLKILETSHPSELSAWRGFMNCNHFNEANEHLVSCGHRPIKWNKL